MGICPNCGSWVDEGDICSGCGSSGGYSYSVPKQDNSDSVKIKAKDEINKAAYIINSEMSYDNRNLEKARRMLYKTRSEINNCLNQGNVNEEISLKGLKLEIEDWERKIELKIKRNGEIKQYKEKKSQREK